MEILSRHYLLSYHKQSFYGFWKSILDNPPCKKPETPRNKQFEYELEAINDGTNHILYLHLIGAVEDLDGVEKQLSKYKIARIEPPNLLILIVDTMPDMGAMHMFSKFCQEKEFYIKGKEIHKKDSVVKAYR